MKPSRRQITAEATRVRMDTPADLKNPKCPLCGRQPIRLTWKDGVGTVVDHVTPGGMRCFGGGVAGYFTSVPKGFRR